MPDDDASHRLRRPSLDDFIFEGESPPLLLRRGVLIGLVLVFFAVLALYIVISEALGISYSIDARPLRDWIDDRGIWAPLVFMVFMALSVLFAPIPNVPIFIAAGLIWGPVLGTIYSMGGMMLGSALAFYAARILGRRYLPRLIGRKAATRLDALVDSMGGRLVLFARLIPIVNFDWISMVAGLTAIRFWTFFVYSFIGMLPPTIIAVVAGDTLEKDVRITFAIGGLWVLGLLVSAIILYRRRTPARRAA